MITNNNICLHAVSKFISSSKDTLVDCLRFSDMRNADCNAYCRPFGYLRPKAVLVLCNSTHTSFCLGVNDMLQQDGFFSPLGISH